MKNTGLSFFIIRTTRLIVAMVVLFAICKPIAADVEITGVGNLAPNCEDNIKALCNHAGLGDLERVTVTPRDCNAICTYRPPGPDTMVVNGVSVWNRKYERVNLPQGMPCAFGAKCDRNGQCICRFCN